MTTLHVQTTTTWQSALVTVATLEMELIVQITTSAPQAVTIATSTPPAPTQKPRTHAPVTGDILEMERTASLSILVTRTMVVVTLMLHARTTTRQLSVLVTQATLATVLTVPTTMSAL
jgi:hypothetical protein